MPEFDNASNHVHLAATFLLEDLRIRRFRYHLLRLNSVLTAADAEDLQELARQAFQKGAAADAADKIKERSDASPLARTIADITRTAALLSPGREKEELMGALMGAYLSTSGIQGVDRSLVACLGAIAGAITLKGKSIRDDLPEVPLSEYLSTAD
ncbi:hypothetical protein JK361_30210 [Streptomyces sp. 5-8]|uniref:Uncharacterized protein n=1 Tax=Streptomyces musisoli TaxID=2802280 RepID=A0ABS1P970_9ACTN|nr:MULTISPECIES: hypothetical protein [Streptomyces]MBL1108809.1 hypothetical protein [Streptomyces musisoli]MBY8842937.1 hypothetical protein [Streptomyces sp. SP2-10]